VTECRSIPRPARRRAVLVGGGMTFDEILERTQWDFFWVPDDVRVVDRPELAYLSCSRDAAYVNLVLRTRADEEAPALVEEVRGAHPGRTSRWLVTPTWDHRALASALARGGYEPESEHDAAVLASDVELGGGPFEVRRVSDFGGMLDWMRVVLRAFPAPGEPPPERELRRSLAQCTGGAARVARHVAYDGGEPIAAGGISAFPGMSFGLLWAGATVPEARGRGAYRAVLAARVALARRMGLRHVGLYAKSDTSSPVVARAGFTLHGKMSIWSASP